jgi:hypothetical protein
MCKSWPLVTLGEVLMHHREYIDAPEARMYPKLWANKNGERKGYMPACANDGVYTLCGKRKTPHVKCSDCNHQA